MNKTEIGEENPYYEMDSKQGNNAGIYDDVVCESKAPATKQTAFGKQKNEKKKTISTEPAHSCQANIIIDQRLLCIITAVVAVSFLTAAATFILALTMMMSRNYSTAATDCATVQASTSATKNLADELQEIKKNISYMVAESMVIELKGKNLSAECNKSKSYSDKDNITALWQAIQANRREIIHLDQKMINVSKTQGPRGPPGPSGYNGTQGPPGKTGTSGSPGPSGPGNLSLCSYNKKTGDAPVSAGSFASTDVSATETKGKKFLGVYCGTNDASVISLSSSSFPDGRRIYTCLCKMSVSSGAGTMYCYIHYWECPT